MMFSGLWARNYSFQNYNIKNLITISMTLTVSLLFFFQYFIDYSTFTFKDEKFVFFNEPIFYLAIVFNFTSQLMVRIAGKKNEKNLVFMEFANFAFIAFVPIFSYFLVIWFNFEGSINIKYNSISEMFLFSLLMFLFSCLYFVDKIKSNRIKRLDLIILMIINSTIAFVLVTKLMQQYNSEAIYFCTMASNTFIWAFLAYKGKELQHVENKHYFVFFVCGMIYVVYSFLNLIIVKYLPVEHLAIIRTVVSIFCASIFDSIKIKRFTLSFKDIFILSLILLSILIIK
jgi:hypothetical protein